MSPTTPPDVLWLDGAPDEAVVVPSGEPRRALGSDPFAADPVPDPFSARLAGAPIAVTPTGPAQPIDVTSGVPLQPSDAKSGQPLRPIDVTSGQPLQPSDAASGEPLQPSDAASGVPLQPSDAKSGQPLQPSDAASEPLRPIPPTPPEPTRPVVVDADAQDPEPGAPRRQSRPAWTRTPRIDEVELPDRASLAELLLDDDVRRRLAALTHLSEGGAPYDRYGFSPAAAQTAFPFFHALYRAYFRVRSEGHERLPVEGPAVLAANHGGLLPFDGAMTVVDVLLHTDPPRLPRAVVDRWAGTLPWVNVFFARVGQVIGTRENVVDLLGDGQLVLVFPEGMGGVRKNVTQRYRLQRFHVGFVEAALQTRAPIVPMAVLGADDQAPILFDLSTLARRLSLPFFPVTPTFPWLGPLGLLPYPVSYKIVYGEPLHFHEKFGPEAAGDAQLVRYLANRVRREVQLLVDRHR